jgi:hypothetical protein
MGEALAYWLVMSTDHDPISELTLLLERSHNLLLQLRCLESRVEEVTRRIAEFTKTQKNGAPTEPSGADCKRPSAASLPPQEPIISIPE